MVSSSAASSCIHDLSKIIQRQIISTRSTKHNSCTNTVTTITRINNATTNTNKRAFTTSSLFTPRIPVKSYPLGETPKSVPSHIVKPQYALNNLSGSGPIPSDNFYINDDKIISKMKHAAKVARNVLDLACDVSYKAAGNATTKSSSSFSTSTKTAVKTTDDVDTIVHETLISKYGAYPSPLNYHGFPKSSCSSVNEVICHGIPDTRPIQYGDVISFDISCYVNGVHGDNCATIIVGDYDDDDVGKMNNKEKENCDWRGIPYKTKFDSDEEEEHFVKSRRLISATYESLYAGIEVCRPGGCLSDIGAAIHDVVDKYGYDTVTKYTGHGICHIFHCAPYVKHYRNNDKLPLEPGMIFTIEPMLTEGKAASYIWPKDNWTVATIDNSLSAQFEHTILITENGYEILTLP